MRIALLDHVGYGNLGDEATLAAVLLNVRSRCPNAEVLAITFNPEQTRNTHNIEALTIHRDCTSGPAGFTGGSPYRRRLSNHPLLWAILRFGKGLLFRWPREFVREFRHAIRSFRALEGVDLLVVAGGGQLRDKAFGQYAFPYNIWKWVVLSRLRGARAYFVNQGAGPLKTATGRYFLKSALGKADYVSFRDRRSRDLLMSAGWKGESAVHPDCVYGLPADLGGPSSRLDDSAQSVIGISPMRVYWDRDPRIYEKLIDDLGDLGASLSLQNRTLCLFSTENPADDLPISDLAAAISKRAPAAKLDTAKIHDLAEVWSCMRRMDFVVTCRFHGVVFAHRMGIPVLAIAHHPKVSTLMHDLGLSEFCIEVADCTPDRLTDLFASLTARSDEIRSHMLDSAERYRLELMRQFDSLFPIQKATTNIMMRIEERASLG